MTPPRARSTVAGMAGYTPGEQPRPGAVVIKLNTNENPYPPSPKVFDAIRAIGPDALRRYPSSMADAFRAVAARVHGVSPDQILAGNGSDDILQIALRTYCGQGDVLASPDPTYSLYPVLAELADVTLVTVPWDGLDAAHRSPARDEPTGDLLREPERTVGHLGADVGGERVGRAHRGAGAG